MVTFKVKNYTGKFNKCRVLLDSYGAQPNLHGQKYPANMMCKRSPRTKLLMWKPASLKNKSEICRRNIVDMEHATSARKTIPIFYELVKVLYNLFMQKFKEVTQTTPKQVLRMVVCQIWSGHFPYN